MNKDLVIELVVNQIKRKLSSYSAETNYMPFHNGLLGRDRMALFSFIQSFNTSIGTSIYEQVAKLIAKNQFDEVETQYNFNGTNEINQSASLKIAQIIGDLTVGREIDYQRMHDEIKAATRENNGFIAQKPIKADIFLRRNNEYYFIDIKTVKPNIGDYQKYKQTMLHWLAIHYQANPNTNAHSLIAIPYNPYYPNPYQRWTMRGMIDLSHEIKIAEEFWDFLGGAGSYNALIESFEQAGSILRPIIDEYFQRFK